MDKVLAVRLLEEAKKAIAGRGHEWPLINRSVCIALSKVVYRIDDGYLNEIAFERNRKCAKQLRQWIWKSMNHQGSVKDWLAEQGYHLSTQELQAYRLLWIDQMIGVIKNDS